MAATEFHFILLYPNVVQVVSRLSDEIVWECGIGVDSGGTAECGATLGLVVDAAGCGAGATPDGSAGTVEAHALWVYTERALFRVRVLNEGRDAWRLYLELRSVPVLVLVPAAAAAAAVPAAAGRR